MILNMSQTRNDIVIVKISYQLANQHKSQTCHESIYQYQNKLPTKTRQPGYQERQVIYLSGLASLGSSLFPYLS
ncbi:hypothetical protein LguiA_026106 [Lonicera macranthoides]